MTAPALTRHQLRAFMRSQGCVFVRATTSNNHELWRDQRSNRVLTVGPRIVNTDAIVRTLRNLRRAP